MFTAVAVAAGNRKVAAASTEEPIAGMKRRLLGLALCSILFLPGCSWLGWGEDPPRRPDTHTGVPSRPNAVAEGPKVPPPGGTTMADRRLQRIYDKQEETLRQLEERPEDFPATERDRVLDSILTEYQAFVLENPNYVYAFILYGKFLRQVGEREAANVAFVRANSLDPQIAVVKQQIGNYLVENGQPVEALGYYTAAIELEPDNALYRYQLGETLYQFNEHLVEVEGMPREVLEEQMISAFAEASRLDPGNRAFLMRYTEAFFDVQNPDWSIALNNWDNLESTATDSRQRDIIRLQKARVLLAMGRRSEASALLAQIDRPTLQSAKEQLMN